jgi:hypothetical protein
MVFRRGDIRMVLPCVAHGCLEITPEVPRDGAGVSDKRDQTEALKLHSARSGRRVEVAVELFHEHDASGSEGDRLWPLSPFALA